MTHYSGHLLSDLSEMVERAEVRAKFASLPQPPASTGAVAVEDGPDLCPACLHTEDEGCAADCELAREGEHTAIEALENGNRSLL